MKRLKEFLDRMTERLYKSAGQNLENLKQTQHEINEKRRRHYLQPRDIPLAASVATYEMAEEASKETIRKLPFLIAATIFASLVVSAVLLYLL